MEISGFGELFAAALSGGIVVKAIEIAYAEIKGLLSQSDARESYADLHLEPLLKSADELVGKLRSLSEGDFKAISKVDPEDLENHEFASLLYLFGRFWAQIELMRQQGMTRTMALEKRGQHLQAFFDCLESKRVRIISRILQRAVGESLMHDGKIRTFIEFSSSYMKSDDRQWIAPLAMFLSRTEHTTERQQLLQYGAVIHAMVDTLDPEHKVTRQRPSWPNKLTKKSWRDLKYRVFNHYLKMVADPAKYIGPPKKSGPHVKGESSAKRL